jgi:hypothetical protein
VENLKYSKSTESILPKYIADNYLMLEPSGVTSSRRFLHASALNVAVARYRLRDPDQAWIGVLREQLLAAGLNVFFYEKDCGFFDSRVTSNPFWLVRFIPSYRDPIMLFSIFERGGSWIPTNAEITDDVYHPLILAGFASESEMQVGEAVTSLHRIFGEQVRGIPLFENPVVLSLRTSRISGLGMALQSGTLYFEHLDFQK